MFRFVLVLTLVLACGCARADDVPRQVVASYDGTYSSYSVKRIGAAGEHCTYRAEVCAWRDLSRVQVMREFDHPDSAIVFAERSRMQLVARIFTTAPRNVRGARSGKGP